MCYCSLPLTLKYNSKLNTYLVFSLNFFPLRIFSSPRFSFVLFVFFSCCLEATKFLIISGFPDLAPAQCFESGSSMSICFGLAACADCSAVPAVSLSGSRLCFLQNFHAMQATIQRRSIIRETTMETIMVVCFVIPEKEMKPLDYK